MAAASDTDDWQANKTLQECNRYMLDNQIGCDVTFILGENEVRKSAHRCILSSRSSVFFAMFYGLMADGKKEICVPDIEADVFHIFLEYLYCDEIKVEADTVLPLLYASKKYSVQTLARECLQFLEKGKNVDNICTILEQAHLFDENELHSKCLHYIFENGNVVLQTPGLLDVCKGCVERVVEADELQAEEKTVLDAILKWSESQCQKKSIEVNEHNKRKVLGKILHLVRFPLLGTTYFTETVSDLDILNDTEKVELFKFFYKKSSTTSFINRTRYVHSQIARLSLKARHPAEGSSIQTCIRFPTIHDDGSWYCGGEPDAIAFTCTTKVWIHGALIYGSYLGECKYDAICSLYDNNEKEVGSIQMEVKTSEHQQTYAVLLEEPIEVAQGRKFSILVRITSRHGSDTYQGKSGMPSVTCGNAKFSFYRSKLSRNGTDTKVGQIPGLLFTID